MNPTFTVCATCYNHEKFIPEFIESVLAQTFSDWELVVVDDCSTDGSFRLLQKCAESDSRIRVVCNDRNRHVCYSGNRAATMVRGEYVTLMSCDDLLLPFKLENDVRFFNEHADVSALYTDLYQFSGSVEEKSDFAPMPADFSRANLLRQQLFVHNSLWIPGLTIRREIIPLLGEYFFNPCLRMTHDHDLHLRILERFEVARSPVKTVCYRRHDNQLSGRRPDVEASVFNETVWVLKNHYLRSPLSVEDIRILCPDYAKYGALTQDAVPYFLARAAIDQSVSREAELAAVLTLFELASDADYLHFLEQTCHFSLMELMRLGSRSRITDCEDYLRERTMRCEEILGLVDEIVRESEGLKDPCDYRVCQRMSGICQLIQQWRRS